VNPAPLHPDHAEGHVARLLDAYVLAVRHMLDCQRTWRAARTEQTQREMEAAEREVESMTTLHLLPPLPLPLPASSSSREHTSIAGDDQADEEDTLLAEADEHAKMFATLARIVKLWEKVNPWERAAKFVNDGVYLVAAVGEARKIVEGIKKRVSASPLAKSTSQDAPGSTNDNPAG